MIEILVGSLLLSLIHAAIPNHWLPLVSVAKSENWPMKKTLLATSIAGISHTLSTLFIGIAVGYAGVKLSNLFHNRTQQFAALVLIGLGVIYIVIEQFNKQHHHHPDFNNEKKGKSTWAIIAALSFAMFLTPCVEIEAYYFRAGTQGWTGIFAVSAVYVLVTLVTMLVLTYLGLKGANKIRSHFLEHHEKSINGVILIALGIFVFFSH